MAVDVNAINSHRIIISRTSSRNVANVSIHTLEGQRGQDQRSSNSHYLLSHTHAQQTDHVTDWDADAY